MLQFKCFQYTGLVNEVTDDKSLEKQKRKELQIEHAPHTSPRAKLVKLADKLYNLRDLLRCSPEGWSEQRVQVKIIESAIWKERHMRLVPHSDFYNILPAKIGPKLNHIAILFVALDIRKIRLCKI